MHIDNKLATLYAIAKGWQSRILDDKGMAEIDNPQTPTEFLLETIEKEVRVFLADKEGQKAKKDALSDPDLISDQ